MDLLRSGAISTGDPPEPTKIKPPAPARGIDWHGQLPGWSPGLPSLNSYSSGCSWRAYLPPRFQLNPAVRTYLRGAPSLWKFSCVPTSRRTKRATGHLA